MPLLPFLPVRDMADHHQDHKPKVTFDKAELKAKLTREQYEVTQEQGTEAPWTGKSFARYRKSFLTAVSVRQIPESER